MFANNSSVFFIIMLIASVAVSIVLSNKSKAREAREAEERKLRESAAKKASVNAKVSSTSSGAKAVRRDESIFTNDPLMKPGSIANNIGKQNLTVMEPYRNQESAKIRSSNADHLHPVTGKVKTEKAFTTNSAGGAITEGCVEHYYSRSVLQKETSSNAVEMTDLQKILIYGNIINKRVGR